MALILRATRRADSSVAPQTRHRAIYAALSCTLLSVCSVVGWSMFSLSSARPLPVPEIPLQVEKPAPRLSNVGDVAHRLALAFAAAKGMGLPASRPSELVGTVLQTVPVSQPPVEWALDGYTLRSRSVSAEICAEANKRRGPYESEQPFDGLHCHRGVGGLWLAYRLEEIAPEDRLYQQVSFRISVFNGVAVAQLATDALPRTECAPSGLAAGAVAYEPSLDQELLTGHVCVPVWSWENVSHSAGVAVHASAELLALTGASGGRSWAIRVRTAHQAKGALHQVNWVVEQDLSEAAFRNGKIVR